MPDSPDVDRFSLVLDDFSSKSRCRWVFWVIKRGKRKKIKNLKRGWETETALNLSKTHGGESLNIHVRRKSFYMDEIPGQDPCPALRGACSGTGTRGRAPKALARDDRSKKALGQENAW